MRRRFAEIPKILRPAKKAGGKIIWQRKFKGLAPTCADPRGGNAKEKKKVLESVLISDLHEKGSTGGRLMVGSGGVWGEDRQSMRNTFTSNCCFFLVHRRDALAKAEREGPSEHAENFLVIFTKKFSPRSHDRDNNVSGSQLCISWTSVPLIKKGFWP